MFNLFGNKKPNENNSDGKKGCIFCGTTPLTREHIYPKWSFDLFGVPETCFQPVSQATVITHDNLGFQEETITATVSEPRDTPYRDFVIKAVCKSCNEGWMSEIESAMQKIFSKLLNGDTTLEQLSCEDAFLLSRWCIIKVALISKTMQVTYELDSWLIKMIMEGIIPEGFIVEATDMLQHAFNFQVSRVEALTAFKISSGEMEIAEENSMMGVLHIGQFGFRVSFLRSAIAVHRLQVIEKELLLYPYHGELPYVKGSTNFDRNLMPAADEVGIFSSRLRLVDHFNPKPGAMEFVERISIVKK